MHSPPLQPAPRVPYAKAGGSRTTRVPPTRIAGMLPSPSSAKSQPLITCERARERVRKRDGCQALKRGRMPRRFRRRSRRCARRRTSCLRAEQEQAHSQQRAAAVSRLRRTGGRECADVADLHQAPCLRLGARSDDRVRELHALRARHKRGSLAHRRRLLGARRRNQRQRGSQQRRVLQRRATRQRLSSARRGAGDDAAATRVALRGDTRRLDGRGRAQHRSVHGFAHVRTRVRAEAGFRRASDGWAAPAGGAYR